MFITYLTHLLLFAFWNPNGWFFSIFGWITTIYAIFFFSAQGQRSECMKKGMWKFFNTYRVPIIWTLVLVCLVVSAYTLQTNNINIQNTNRPILSIHPTPTESITSSTTFYSDDQTAVSSIGFPILNVGNSTCYQLTTRIGFCPAYHPDKCSSVADNLTINPIQPTDAVVASASLSQQYNVANDSLDNPVIWFYIKLSYSDALSDGIWYSNIYWFSFDLNAKTCSQLQAQDIQMFQPFITTYFEQTTTTK
jgi:hypothetical protein